VREQVQIAILLGSSRQPRLGDRVCTYVLSRAQEVTGAHIHRAGPGRIQAAVLRRTQRPAEQPRPAARRTGPGAGWTRWPRPTATCSCRLSTPRGRPKSPHLSPGRWPNWSATRLCCARRASSPRHRRDRSCTRPLPVQNGRNSSKGGSNDGSGSRKARQRDFASAVRPVTKACGGPPAKAPGTAVQPRLCS